MPTYDISTAAFAAFAPKKWVDNACSHCTIPGVESNRRGVTRRFSFHGIMAVALTRILTEEAGIPLQRAGHLAAEILESRNAELTLAPGLRFCVDIQTMTRRLQQRVLEAAESIPRARRGRPPAKRRGQPVEPADMP